MLHSRSKFAAALLLLLLAGCALLRPAAPGLVDANWSAREFQREQQVEVLHGDNSFSFLLYQQQRGISRDLIGLSLTGQTLFHLQFDGRQLSVIECIDAMRYLPFEFVVRDILLATDSGYQPEQIERASNGSDQFISINGQAVLRISQQQDTIELNNLRVPYRMLLRTLNTAATPDSDTNPHD